jgi:hypothetical protein
MEMPALARRHGFEYPSHDYKMEKILMEKYLILSEYCARLFLPARWGRSRFVAGLMDKERLIFSKSRLPLLT